MSKKGETDILDRERKKRGQMEGMRFLINTETIPLLLIPKGLNKYFWSSTALGLSAEGEEVKRIAVCMRCSHFSTSL